MDWFLESYADSSDEEGGESKNVDDFPNKNAPEKISPEQVENLTKNSQDGGVDAPPKAHTSTQVKADLKERFHALQERKRKLTEKSTQLRIKQMQSEAISKVLSACESEEDRALIDPDLHQMEPLLEKRHKQAEDPEACDAKPSASGQSDGSQSASGQSDGSQSASGEAWMELKPYLNQFDQFKGVDKGKHAPKCELEERIDTAIRLGDAETAERLSDRLSSRQLAVKIAGAFDAKSYLANKQKEAATQKTRGKKRLSWMFEPKERWQMKGNM